MQAALTRETSAAKSTGVLQEVIEIAREASEIVMKHYGRNVVVTDKTDGSPVTEADLASSRHLTAALEGRWQIPVISEEGPMVEYDQRKDWDRLWLIDPLDGTKDFIARTGEFAINIALIEAGRPVLGVIAAPARQRLWHAEKGGGACRVRGGEAVEISNERKSEPLVGLTSRFHASKRTAAYFGACGITDVRICGSALKLARIAQGDADLYPSFRGTKEWDTAAGQIILEEAGCGLVRMQDKAPIRYNRPDVMNPPFVATSHRPLLPPGVPGE